MTDIMREEGEIFALEQLLSEKRQLVRSPGVILHDLSREEIQTE
jgi:hypothetical protein